MLDFVDLASDADELRRMLVQLGLARAGDPLQVTPLTGGVSSNIFRLDLPGGAVCVKQALPKLKVAKDWHAPVSRVLAEIDWLTQAQSIAPGHVPRIIAADRERGAFVMEYLAQTANWKAELLGGRADEETARDVARVLAAIHSATARNAQIQARFANDATFYLLRLEPYLVETARIHPDLACELIGLVATTQSTPLALIHGDVSPKNILLGPTGPVLLDAECATYGDPAFDMAFLLNHLLLKAAHLPAWAERFADTFSAIAAEYLPRVDWEMPGAFDRRCARLLPGLLLARVDGKSPVEYLDERSRIAVRHAARSLVRTPPASLSVLLEQWMAAVGSEAGLR